MVASSILRLLGRLRLGIGRLPHADLAGLTLAVRLRRVRRLLQGGLPADNLGLLCLLQLLLLLMVMNLLLLLLMLLLLLLVVGERR